MKTTILTCLLPCLFIIGCTEKQNPLPLSNDFHSEKTADNEPLEGLVFSESSGTYMLPKEDPYSLSNFQRALKNVLNGCSEIEFPNGITKSSFENINLSPTHLALKIYPRNEQEQWAIELMEDVKVSYIPFNYTQVPDKDSLALKSAIESGVPSFHELNPHIEVYDEVTAKDGPAISESFRLPILYVVWPYNELKSRLQNYVGTYYTEQDLTTYLSNYEYWFSNN